MNLDPNRPIHPRATGLGAFSSLVYVTIAEDKLSIDFLKSILQSLTKME